MSGPAGDRERLEGIRRQVYETAPAAVPFIRELVECGLITGWRNVAAVYQGRPRELAGAVTADVYLANSKALRTKNGTVTDDVQ